MRLQVDQARVKELFLYDEMTGMFTWKKRSSPSHRVKIGEVAGCLRGDGYWSIRFDGHNFKAHRLAWLYVHGVTPPAELDHINGSKNDNRIANLRLATRTENMWNSPGKPSLSGLKGAHWRAERNVWRSAILKNGRRFYLGCFATAEEAHAAYVKAATEFHGEFARAR